MTVDVQGLITCSRYSFAPNSLHFCGPERQNDMLGYVSGSLADRGLMEILNQFETLYPYLLLIASENHIADPFDRRVVEAYWLGNRLLSHVRMQSFAAHITDNLDLKRKLKPKQFSPMMDHLTELGVPQHTFHVLTIFIRTGHMAVEHTLSTMDQCRISWGKVVDAGDECVVEVRPLIYQNKQLMLGKPERRVVTCVGMRPKKGDWVSVHWGYICEVLSAGQRLNLARYTIQALAAANKQQKFESI
jgi:hypothetical protein